MHKVLVIAYYFPPIGLSGVQRTLKFVKYFKNYNWEPTVLTTSDIGYYAHDNSLLKEVEDANIKVERVTGGEINSLIKKNGTVKIPSEKIRKLFSYISQTFFIPDNKVNWSKKAIEKAREILKREKFDIIFVTAPPFSTFNMAVELKKEFNVPLVIDYRDLWFESYFSFYPTLLHKSMQKKMEYNALKAADKITVTNRVIKEKIMNTYQFLSYDDVTILTHGFDPMDFKNLEPEKRTNKRMIISYSGIFMEYNSPEYFLKAFKEISIERPEIAANIELHFIGFLRKENKKLVKKLQLEDFVKDFGYIEHKEAVRKLVSSDLLWFMIGKKQNIDALLPGKLFEYVGSKKPILACIPDGAAKNVLQKYGASFITDPFNINEIKSAIIKVYELYKNNNLPKPDENFIEQYRRDFLTEQLCKEFQFCMKAEE
ncbi:MAG: glycosyl transferase family 1 [Ignavibacteriales bacterium CG12_big_fil_rev_8_21_14_0_65_30_8]|nr:MAG: glycosyl transferase family 1 [Ignavibacteriales bacterium CG12_big_fil_rev_8_21_14_0_65_30_8]